MVERKYRVNPECPNCGEEHASWLVTITEDEQAVVEAYYAKKQFKSSLDMILAEIYNPPLRVNKELRCPVCRKSFKAIVPICLTSNVNYQSENIVPMGVHPIWDLDFIFKNAIYKN